MQLDRRGVQCAVHMTVVTRVLLALTVGVGGKRICDGVTRQNQGRGDSESSMMYLGGRWFGNDDQLRTPCVAWRQAWMMAGDNTDGSGRTLLIAVRPSQTWHCKRICIFSSLLGQVFSVKVAILSMVRSSRVTKRGGPQARLHASKVVSMSQSAYWSNKFAQL